MALEILDKGCLRKSIYDSRNKVSKETKQKMDFDIFSILTSSKEYKNCDTLFIYVSKSIEVDTYSIMKDAFKKKKIVIVPKCNPGDLTMTFYKVKSFSDLEKGYFKIYEPIEEKCEKVYDFSNGLCIVPGLCFDIYGYRIGYGKGYYDRFLKGVRGIKIGICYSDYIFKSLPTDSYDEKVDILVTEKNMLEVVV